MKKINYVILIAVFCCLLNEHCISQVALQWAVRYNGPGNHNDWAKSIVVDGSGNVYVTGNSYDNSTDDDYATIKYNSAGVQQWVKRFGSSTGSDVASSVAVDGSGNVYVTGRSQQITGPDYVTVKYNSAGVEQWSKRYNGSFSSDDWARSIATWGGNVYVTGRSRTDLPSTSYEYVTIKYNSAGAEQWVQKYNGPGNNYDDATFIVVDGSGNVYVTGGSVGSGTGLDYATIKYNSAGVQEWVRRYNGPGNDYDRPNSLAVDGSGNVYVTGESWGSGTGYDYATIKYNSAGVQQWAPRYNGPANNFDQALSLAVDGVGNVFVTGNSGGSGTSQDYATIKYSSLGFQQWASRYNGPGNGNDNAASIVIDGLGFIYVTGSSYGGSGTLADYATLKYNNAGGIQQWVQRFNGPGNGNDVANSLAVDGTGNVYVTGSSYDGSSILDDYATIKYSQPVGIAPISNQIPEAFRLEQNYPNPFNPTTKIRFNVPQNSRGPSINVKLAVYDILGNESAILVNEELQPGKYEVTLNTENLSSGVYFYILKSSEFSDTKKMMIVK